MQILKMTKYASVTLSAGRENFEKVLFHIFITIFIVHL